MNFEINYGGPDYDKINLAGNIEETEIFADDVLSISLKQGGNELLNELYTPNAAGLVYFRFNQTVLSELRFVMPNSDLQIQSYLVRDFVLKIANTNIPFKAIKTSIKSSSHVNSENWLKANFLTWQPQTKEVTYYQPECLTYCSVGTATTIKVKAYFTDDSSQEKDFYTLAANQAYTFNVSYDYVRAQFTKNIEYYDVYAVSGSTRLSYVQRYALKPDSKHAEIFEFENGLGGLDTVYCDGETRNKPEYEIRTAVMSNKEVDYRTKKTDVVTQSTGYISREAAQWLQDFFVSTARYVRINGNRVPIVLTDVSGETNSGDDMIAFSFDYKLAETSDYLNLTRDTGMPPKW